MRLSILISIICFFSLSVFANTNQYKIESKVYINGELVSQPRIITMPDEPAQLSQESEGRKVALTHTVKENKGDLGGADVQVTSKLELLTASSQKITQSTVNLTFDESKQSAFSYQKTILNDNSEVKTVLEVKSKILKL